MPDPLLITANPSVHRRSFIVFVFNNFHRNGIEHVCSFLSSIEISHIILRVALVLTATTTTTTRKVTTTPIVTTLTTTTTVY